MYAVHSRNEFTDENENENASLHSAHSKMRAWSLALVLTLVLGALDVGYAKEAEEERLIGWLGEVERPPAPVDVTREDAVDGGLAPKTDGDSHSRERSDSTTSEERRGEASIRTLSWSPRVFLYSNFLSEEECEHLIELGEKNLERSTVVGGAGDSGTVASARTSYGTFITRRLTPTLSAIEDRVAEYSGIPWQNQEQLQLLRYKNGQEYVHHHDGIRGDNGGRRIATVLMFLREPDFGGETNFPQARPLPEVKEAFIADKSKYSECGWNSGNGFSVIPKRGDAVLFFSYNINGTIDPAADHASCPTLRGTKYTATKWIHENAFDTGTFKTPTCEDEQSRCAGWAASGECEKNPVYMMGVESVGACSKSCCEVMDRSKLSDTQRRFCEPCDK